MAQGLLGSPHPVRGQQGWNFYNVDKTLFGFFSFIFSGGHSIVGPFTSVNHIKSFMRSFNFLRMKEILSPKYCFTVQFVSFFLFFLFFSLFFKVYFYLFLERESQPSRLLAVSSEPDAGLKLRNCEITTWAEIRESDAPPTEPPQRPCVHISDCISPAVSGGSCSVPGETMLTYYFLTPPEGGPSSCLVLFHRWKGFFSHRRSDTFPLPWLLKRLWRHRGSGLLR